MSMSSNYPPRHVNLKWTDELIFSLIRLKRAKRHLFTGRRNSAKCIWIEIVKELGVDDLLTWEQARKKWNNLIAKYKSLKDPLSAEIADGAQEPPENWPFLHEMELTVNEHEDPTDITNASMDQSASTTIPNDYDPTTKPLFRWSDEMVFGLIRLRKAKKMLFTGKRNSAKNVWIEIIKQLGLDSEISWEQARKKWNNLVAKYKAIKESPSGIRSDDGNEETAESWPFYSEMDLYMQVMPNTLEVATSSIIQPEVQKEQQTVVAAEGTNVVPSTESWTGYADIDRVLKDHHIISTPLITLADGSTQVVLQNETIPEGGGPPKRRKKISDTLVKAIEESNAEIRELTRVFKQQSEVMCYSLKALVNKLNQS